MNLKQLEHLLAVAESGSFSRAAQRQHLTQSALSRSIRLLEDDLGVRLLDRLGKQTELTPVGLAVAARARRLLFDAAELRRSTDLLTQAGYGLLRIGMGPGPGAMLTTPFMAHTARRFPELRVDIQPGSPEVHLALLRERRLDVLVADGRRVSPAADLRVEAVSNMRAGFVCRAAHPLTRRRRPPPFSAVAKYPLASTFLAPETERIFIEHFGVEAEPSHCMRLRCEDINSLLEAVRVSNAVFVGIVGAAKAGIAAGELVELQTDPPLRSHAPFIIVTLAGRTEAPAMAVLRDFVREHLRD